MQLFLTPVFLMNFLWLRGLLEAIICAIIEANTQALIIIMVVRMVHLKHYDTDHKPPST